MAILPANRAILISYCKAKSDYMKLFFQFLFIAILISVSTQKVNAQLRCSSDEHMAPILQQNKAYEKDIDATKEHLQSYLSQRTSSPQDVIIIPVHVVIIHPLNEQEGQGANLSVDHIVSQIDVMNLDFRRLNLDAANTPPEFEVSDSMIEFCMASVDPQGQPTDGITRFATDDDFDDNEFDIKQQTGWPRDNYLNVWVDANIGALGYAYVPGVTNLPNPVLDGIVCRTSAFGGPGFSTHPVYNLGRTATHEIGHYLGLRHIWRNDGCGADDGFDDTPKQDEENFGCPSHPSPSCENNGDMFMNYMDYVNDNCMNSFSTEQGAYMQLILNSSRSSLLTAANTFCTIEAAILTAQTDEIIDVSCFELLDGSVTLSASGGIPPYLYSVDGINYFDSNVFTDLAAGEYNATIEDSDGTITEIEFEILEPSEITFELFDFLNPSCFGESNGFVEIEVTSDFAVNDYFLNGEIYSTGLFENLQEGIYTLEITDDNNCSASFEFEMTQPEELLFTQLDLLGIGCNEELGELATQANGGIGEISYSIDGEIFFTIGAFDELQTGDYQLLAMDENGCQIEEEFSISAYEQIQLASEEIFHISCFGSMNGQILISSSGGNGNISYSLDGINFQNENSFIELGKGTYNIYGKDLNGCIDSLSVDITEPFPLNIENSEKLDVSCFGESDGSFQINALGGTGQISYSINGVDYLSNGSFDNLIAGNYILKFKDENDCIDSTSLFINEPSEFKYIATEITPLNCPGGLAKVDLTLESSSESFSIEIEGLDNNYSKDWEIIDNISGGTFTDDQIPAGQFQFTITELNECSLYIDTFDIEDLAPFSLQTIDILNQSNNELGAFYFDLFGGTAPLQYSLDGINYQSNSGFEGLVAGTYTVYVIDANNCLYEFDVDVLDNRTTSLENELIKQINIWPNPTNDQLNISLPNALSNSIIQFELLNANGQIIKKEARADQIKQGYKMNVSNFPSGVYFLKIYGDYLLGYRKIIIE